MTEVIGNIKRLINNVLGLTIFYVNGYYGMHFSVQWIVRKDKERANFSSFINKIVFMYIFL